MQKQRQLLFDFKTDIPPFMKSQSESYEWLAQAYFLSQSQSEGRSVRSSSDYRRLLQKVGPSGQQIQSRGHYAEEFASVPQKTEDLRLSRADLSTRNRVFERTVRSAFGRLLDGSKPMTDLFHVSCTGYTSPSPIQTWVSEQLQSQAVMGQQSERQQPRCLHMYHMGCYAAIPSLRQAVQVVKAEPKSWVQIAHSELCTLHFDPVDPTAEDMVIQSLFADGICTYSVAEEGAFSNLSPSSVGSTSSAGSTKAALAAVGFYEELIPDSESAMTWEPGSRSFQMTLSKDVPLIVGDKLPDILSRGYGQDQVSTWMKNENVIWAIHPGGPKILDLIQNRFELQDSQIKHSREVLLNRGNMSSATLPHIWKSIVEDSNVALGTKVISMAFGPGLTVTTVLFEKAELK